MHPILKCGLICLSLYFYIFHFLTGLLSGIPLEAAQSSSFCELLLRIDTMVISGMISLAEASDLRERVVTNRSIIQSTFSDIHHKPNTELLSELRLFLCKPIEYATTYLWFLQFYLLLLKVSTVLFGTHVHFFAALAHRIVRWHLKWSDLSDTLRKNLAAEGERKLMRATQERGKGQKTRIGL